MNILLVSDLIVAYGGGETIVINTKRILEKNGHKVFLLGEKTSKKTLVSLFRNWFSLKYYFKTKEIIRKNNIDVVHINACSNYISPSPILAAKKMNKKVVMTIHTFYYYCPKTWGVDKKYKTCQEGYNILCPFYNCPTWKTGIINFPYRFIKWIKVGFHRYLIKKYVDHFVCPSKMLQEFMQKTFKLPEEKISYVANFIETGDSHQTDFLKIKDKQFLFVGRIAKDKGIDVAIKAINILVKEENFQDIKLNIIGEGNEKKKLEKLVEKLNLKKNIKFCGWIENKNLNRHYQESVAVLMPSVCLEAFGLVNIEAMKNGTPMIASNLGGIKDIAEHNKNGYLFEAGNYKELSCYMKKLYKNEALSKELGANGFEKIKKEFGGKRYCTKLVDIYLKINSEKFAK